MRHTTNFFCQKHRQSERNAACMDRELQQSVDGTLIDCDGAVLERRHPGTAEQNLMILMSGFSDAVTI